MRVHSSRSCTFLKQLEAISQTSLPLSDEIVQATAFCVYNCSPLHFQLQKCSAHSLEASLVFAASCCKIFNISQVMQEQKEGSQGRIKCRFAYQHPCEATVGKDRSFWRIHLCNEPGSSKAAGRLQLLGCSIGSCGFNVTGCFTLNIS